LLLRLIGVAAPWGPLLPARHVPQDAILIPIVKEKISMSTSYVVLDIAAERARLGKQLRKFYQDPALRWCTLTRAARSTPACCTLQLLHLAGRHQLNAGLVLCFALCWLRQFL
jgi:hypothetical protein